MLNFDDLFNDLSGTDFEEIPVGIEEFVTSDEYLNMGETPLSEHQYELIRASSQIYHESTLISLYGEEEGRKRYKRETKNEVVAALGKGSGKDFVSTIACSYIVYLLLCLKDPARYYGKPAGDNIDIVNIAVNAAQANNVFFKNFKKRIEGAPWFKGKYTHKSGEMHFDKSVSAYSGHSEREAFEGLNVIFAVLDEISAFAMQSTTGNESAKTAQATYDMWRASITSRFPDEGKLVLLSFPRHANDFIMTRYNQIIAEKEVVTRKYRFKLDPDIPDGMDENEFTIEWEEDHIVSYKMPRVWALKRPSWEVNPTKKIDDYMRDFYENPRVALSRFAAMPSESEGGIFRDPEKIDVALSKMNHVMPTTGVFIEGSPPPRKDTVYYVHVDLAQKVDRCAVSVARVDRWTSRSYGGKVSSPAPVVEVDIIRYWTPTRDKMVDLSEVKDFIVDLAYKGYNLGVVTFDRYALGTDMITYLQGRGIKAETQSVGNEEYMEFAGMVSEERVKTPTDNILKSELLQLKIFPNGKIDHPRSGGKDVADAVVGSVFNAVARTRRGAHDEVEILTLSDMQREEAKPANGAGPIRNPYASPMADEMQEFLSEMRLL